MKLLLLDIETAPHKGYFWGIHRQFLQSRNIVEEGFTMSWAAAWYGDDSISFSSVYHHGEDAMLKEIHSLLDEADAVIHYNGTRFDIPILNKEFITHGMLPPSPYKQIDLLRVARSRFRFVSNKLDDVAQLLGVGSKVKHEGYDLWMKCLNNDKKAWDRMMEYNIGDVDILEKVYEKFKPWINNHPNHSHHRDGIVCPRCSSTDFQFRGIARRANGSYRRAQCNNCGGWFRGNDIIDNKPVADRTYSE